MASGSLPPGVPTDFYARVARIGKDRKAKVIIDVSGEALEEALKEGVYLIKPNVREFRELVGKGLFTEKEYSSEHVDSGWAGEPHARRSVFPGNEPSPYGLIAKKK